jgi:hypothetical protein
MSALGKKIRLCEGGTVMFKCPGCGCSHGVHIAPAADGSVRPVWSFNGNGDRPTFSPSVLVTYEHLSDESRERAAAFRREHGRPMTHDELPFDRKAVCHSFVTDGRIQFLSDCTHALAGQTVDLPDYPGEKSP